MSVFEVTLNCPACGAPLRVQHRFVQVVTCEFCAQVSLLKDSKLDPTGRVGTLAEFPSLLYVGALGSLQGQPFEVIGRLRYQYAEGFWDEWLLASPNDQPAWLVEDEGTFIRYQKRTLTTPPPPFNSLRVGQTILLEGRRLFITEKGEARIAGGEGQLAFPILPGQQVQYVDGTGENGLASLEFTAGEVEFSLGRAVNREDIVIEEA